MSRLYLGFHETMYGKFKKEGEKNYNPYNEFTFTVDAKTSMADAGKDLAGDLALILTPRVIKKETGSLRKYARGIETKLEGAVHMAEFCEASEIRAGKLVMDFLNSHKLKYAFVFDAKDKTYLYKGEKRLSIKNPLKSMTTLYGRVTEIGTREEMLEMPKDYDLSSKPYFETLSIFNTSDLPAFMLSFIKALK